MNVGSLFSGVGGIDLGLERAGMRVVFQCEADEWRRSVLAVRFPGVLCYEDVRRVGGASPEPRGNTATPHLRRAERGSTAVSRTWPRTGRPDGVDLLCGGFPCQDLSVAGRRKGLIDGERSSLFFEFARIADELVRPGGYVLVENVPGLFSSNTGRDFAIVRATLAQLGFLDGAWRVLDSRYLGVPQRRRRVFILARRARGRRACEVLLEPESGGGTFTSYAEAGEEVAGTLGGGAGSRGWSPDTDRMTFVPEVAAPLTKGSAASPGVNAPGRRQEDDSNVIAFYPTEARMAGETWDNISPTIKIGSGGHNGNPPAIAFFSENQRAEVVETEYARQLTTGGGKPGQGYPAVRVGAAVRRLTPRECERLQGFPDDWTALGPDSRRYAALGDAVTVPVAEWIGRRIIEAEAVKAA